MTADDLRLVRYMNADTRRFSFWMIFEDQRMWPINQGHLAKRSLIKFMESYLGPVNDRWQFDYSSAPKKIIIKADSDLDVTMMLLKFQR